jgi:hypothetical protein
MKYSSNAKDDAHATPHAILAVRDDQGRMSYYAWLFFSLIKSESKGKTHIHTIHPMVTIVHPHIAVLRYVASEMALDLAAGEGGHGSR